MKGRARQGNEEGSPSSAIESLLRPGASSEGGFLGAEESLQAVIDEDARTLASLGLDCKTIAVALQQLLSTVIEQENADPGHGKLPPEGFPPSIVDRRSLKPKCSSPLPLNKLPDIDTGYLVGDIQVFCVHWRGFQACPWKCRAAGSHDFLLINRTTGEFVTCPELLPHLILEHQFFEGKQSPYRADPDRLARVLQLCPPVPETKSTFWSRVRSLLV